MVVVLRKDERADGLGVSPGIGFGQALCFKKIALEIPDTPASFAQDEIFRLDNAVNSVVAETKTMAESARASGDDTRADILEAIAMLAEDPEMTDSSRDLIRTESMNAVKAVHLGMRDIIEMFENMDNEYMRERASDIMDIQKRIIMQLHGVKNRDLSSLPPGTIIVAEDLATSDTAHLDFANLSGIVTSTGGQNSHVSIIARNYEIPAVVNVKDILSLIDDGDEIIADGSSGTVYINPSDDTRSLLEDKKKSHSEESERLKKFASMSSMTADGHAVEICANIGTPAEVTRVTDSSADGVGLFRSEFLYMEGEALPDEESQYEAYREVLSALAPKPVIVRTLDIGGDKDIPALEIGCEENPFLGYRAIRISLDRPDIFGVQLRALLRAGVHGNLKIMFPLISCIEELREAKKAVLRAELELKEQGHKYKENVPLGIMIEVPSAVVMADELARECDFFSIGTNDLIQYTTAVDRGNEKVSALYSAYNPAVLRLIAHTIKSAHSAGIECGMCGEAAGDPLLIPLFLGMGLDEFSMSSGSVLRAREIISRLSLADTRALAEEVLLLPTKDDIIARLKS